MALRFDQEIVHLGVDSHLELALRISDEVELDGAFAFVLGLEFLEGDAVAEFQEVFQNLVGFYFWDLRQFVQEFLQDHPPLVQVLVVVPPVLSFLSNWRHRQPRMHSFQHGLEPQEISIAPLDNLAEDGGLHNVGHVGLLEYSSLLLLEPGHPDLQILLEQLIGRHLNAIDDL